MAKNLETICEIAVSRGNLSINAVFLARTGRISVTTVSHGARTIWAARCKRQQNKYVFGSEMKEQPLKPGLNKTDWFIDKSATIKHAYPSCSVIDTSTVGTQAPFSFSGGAIPNYYCPFCRSVSLFDTHQRKPTDYFHKFHLEKRKIVPALVYVRSSFELDLENGVKVVVNGCPRAVAEDVYSPSFFLCEKGLG